MIWTRHWCDQNDGLLKYGWIAHDGRNFGTHDIFESVENSFSIRTSWVKRNGGRDGGDWTARVRLSSFSGEQPPTFVSSLFYFATDYTGWIRSVKKDSPTSASFTGQARDVDKFKVRIDVTHHNEVEDFAPVYFDYTHANVSVTVLKESLLQNGLVIE